jgi:hypothetical protein
MSSKFSMMKSVVVAAALLAGASGVARADDNSMNPYTGESYAYFNGGNLPQVGTPVVATAPSTFRQTNPHGWTFRDYLANTTTGPEWKPAPVVDKSLATFSETHPHGLPISTYQALSSDAPEYHQFPSQPDNSGLASAAGTKSAAYQAPGASSAN